MPIDKSMIQLILGLSQIQGQRRSQDLQEMELDEKHKQFQEMAKQWAHEHEDKDFGDAMSEIAKLAPAQQKAFLALQRSRTVKQNPEFMQALEQFGIASPFAQGIGSMSKEQQTPLFQEAATRALTGQGQGQLAQSGLMGQLATDALGLRQNPAGPTPPPAWNNMVQNYLGQTASGYTPEQFGLQSRQTAVQERGAKVGEVNADTSRGSMLIDRERVELARRELIDKLAVGNLLKKQPGQMTAAENGELRVQMGNLLNAMKDPKSSKEDNMARILLFNELGALVGSDVILPPESIGQPNSSFARFMRSQGVYRAPMPLGGPPTSAYPGIGIGQPTNPMGYPNIPPTPFFRP